MRFVGERMIARLPKHLEGTQQDASLAREKALLEKMLPQKKKEQGAEPCSKNCVDPISPKNLDLILIAGLTLLVRVRAPPETWTTRLRPCGQPEPALLDYLFRLVTIFGNDCSKFEQSAK
jgi:hypothetical protein